MTIYYEDHLESLEFQIQKCSIMPRIDGIFAVNELFATVAMKIAKNIGINVPDDLQIIDSQTVFIKTSPPYPL